MSEKSKGKWKPGGPGRPPKSVEDPNGLRAAGAWNTDLDREARALPTIKTDGRRWCWSCGVWAHFNDEDNKCPECAKLPEPYAVPAECRVALNGSLLQELRRSMGWSQEQLGELWGLGRGSVGHFETGNYQPHGWHLRLLSRILERSMDSLLDGLDATHYKRGHTCANPWEPIWSDEEREVPPHVRRVGSKGSGEPTEPENLGKRG